MSDEFAPELDMPAPRDAGDLRLLGELVFVAAALDAEGLAELREIIRPMASNPSVSPSARRGYGWLLGVLSERSKGSEQA